MQRARNQLFARSGFAQNEDCRIRRRNLLHLLQHLAHRFRGTDNFLKHRRAIDFLSQNEVLVPEPLFRPLLVVDVGCRDVPADDPAVFVFQRVVLNSCQRYCPLLNKARISSSNGSPSQQSYSDARSRTRSTSSGWKARAKKPLSFTSPTVSPVTIQSHPVRVECRAIRRENHDGLANGIGDRAKVLLVLP